MNANITTQQENARLKRVVEIIEGLNESLYHRTLDLELQVKERDDLLEEVTQNYNLGFSVYAAVQRYKELMNPTPKWYDAIPERGVLCWCGDDDDGTGGKHIHVVVSYARGFFTTTRGIPWGIAIPLTNEEIQEFMV
jgi:hypothetical protein